jgi:hypothetical protein
MLVTVPTPDPAPKSDAENPAHKEPGGLCEDPSAIQREAPARAVRAGASPGNRQGVPAYRPGPDARHDRAGAACREGLRAGRSSGPVSGPGRSSAPQMMAPAAKMPAHNQNTVV